MSYILEKWNQIKAGETVVISNQWHDHAIQYFNEHNGEDADLFFKYLATGPNPNQVGVLDTMIAYLTKLPDYLGHNTI